MDPLEGNNLHEFMYGKDSADKFTIFQKGLKEIENRYPGYFKERKAKLFPEEEDNLGFHTMMKFDNYHTMFGFLKDSDLPEYIKVECVNLFNSIYNK